MEIQNNESISADPRMVRLAYTMVTSGRTVAELLEEHGISEEEFTAWVLDGSFAECAAGVTTKMCKAYTPYFLFSLLDCARNGSVPAVKLFFELFWKKSDGASSADSEIETLRADLFGNGA